VEVIVSDQVCITIVWPTRGFKSMTNSWGVD